MNAQIKKTDNPLARFSSLVFIITIGVGLLDPSQFSTNNQGQSNTHSQKSTSIVLAITETVYNPVGLEPDGEWIEITNLGTISINLSAFKIGDELAQGGNEGMLHFPPNSTIAPDQVMIIANRASNFFATYGFDPDYEFRESKTTVPNMIDMSWSSGQVALSNSGDEVLLLDQNDDIIDAISWGYSNDILDPPIPNVQEGHSIERYHAEIDTDTQGDWIDQPNPTPGEITIGQILVTSSDDRGSGTLREALNRGTHGTSIRFEISVFPINSPTTIQLITPLPALTQGNITIDASYTGVILDGSNLMSGDCLHIISDDNTIQGMMILNFPDNGILLDRGATNNTIGGSVSDPANGCKSLCNLISGNRGSGIYIGDTDTMSNTVSGNFIGTNSVGTKSISNGSNGILITDGSYDNKIANNLISGNNNHGLSITSYSRNNYIISNIIGPNSSGIDSLCNQSSGGINISKGAHDNIIGGLNKDEGNLISGNGKNGIIINSSASNNQILGNLIGLTQDGLGAIPNHGAGIFTSENAHGTIVEGNTISGNTSSGIHLNGQASIILDNQVGTNISGTHPVANKLSGIIIPPGSVSNTIGTGNTIAFNKGVGVIVNSCSGNFITQNSIFSNTVSGIQSNCVDAPEIISITLDANDIINGSAPPNGTVEIYSDYEDQGQIYEGQVKADNRGYFMFKKHEGFTGPNLTLITTNTSGNTSSFSPPYPIKWTFLLYLNGDNDLEEYIIDAIQNIAVAGPSVGTNVIALFDGYSNTQETSSAVIYDLTFGEMETISSTLTNNGELNMGSGQTLEDFINWGKKNYPARYTFLSIIGHGGGWAPSISEYYSDTQLSNRDGFMAGISGVSWDFTNDYDYLSLNELNQSLGRATKQGSQPLDVIFLDSSLMGLLEVAFQIKDFSDYLLSPQNLGWAPVGPYNRYVQALDNIKPNTSPEEIANIFVRSYKNSLPTEMHPFVISALNLNSIDLVVDEVNNLATMLTQWMTGTQQTDLLHSVYLNSQKVDYDSDYSIKPDTEGFVDLYDFALIMTNFNIPSVTGAAQKVIEALDIAIVSEAHRSDYPWMYPNQEWNFLDNHGLSIYLPLGEDLEFPIFITDTITETNKISTRKLRLLDMYSNDQLAFVSNTNWDELILQYYDLAPSSVPTRTNNHSISGLLLPDNSPPKTFISITGQSEVGETINLSWETIDALSGLDHVTIMHNPPHKEWSILDTRPNTSGNYPLTLSNICRNRYAVIGTDKSGNTEFFILPTNTKLLDVQPCYELFLSFLLK